MNWLTAGQRKRDAQLLAAIIDHPGETDMGLAKLTKLREGQASSSLHRLRKQQLVLAIDAVTDFNMVRRYFPAPHDS